MAFGFNDGSLLILFGDVTKKKKLTEKIISESSSPVTGLFFVRHINYTSENFALIS
jgi:hypothetical protein